MRILFIHPANTIGGAEISLLELVSFLVDTGVDCRVAIRPSDENQLGRLFEKIGVPVIYLNLPPWPKAWKGSFVKRVEQKLYILYKHGFENVAVKKLGRIVEKWQPDLIHTNTVHCRVGFKLAKSHNIPHVLHLREITGCFYDSLIELRGQANAQKFLQINGRNDGLIANSNYCLKRNKMYFTGKQELVLYNSVNNELFDIKRKQENTKKVVSLVANVTSNVKNHYLFLEIAKDFLSTSKEEVEFRIYGKLPELDDPYLAHLKKSQKLMGLTKKLRFMGLKPVSQIYSETDVLIHTYAYESFGRVLVEAMAAGVPVIALSGGGADELIEHEKTGYLCRIEDGPKPFSVILDLLLSESSNSKIITNRARNFALTFKREKVYNGIITLYRNITKDS